MYLKGLHLIQVTIQACDLLFTSIYPMHIHVLNLVGNKKIIELTLNEASPL